MHPAAPVRRRGEHDALRRSWDAGNWALGRHRRPRHTKQGGADPRRAVPEDRRAFARSDGGGGAGGELRGDRLHGAADVGAVLEAAVRLLRGEAREIRRRDENDGPRTAAHQDVEEAGRAEAGEPIRDRRRLRPHRRRRARAARRRSGAELPGSAAGRSSGRRRHEHADQHDSRPTSASSSTARPSA